jgi:hypothetical protein
MGHAGEGLPRPVSILTLCAYVHDAHSNCLRTRRSTAKVVKYLRAVLNELGLPQKDATDIFEDNAAAIMMVNARRPTE